MNPGVTLPQPKLTAGGIDDLDGRALIDWVRRWRPLRVMVERAAGFVHPWQCAGRWRLGRQRGGRGRWEVRVAPGYVNGCEVEARGFRLEEDEVPTATLERGELFSPWLSESPWLPLPVDRWRNVGADDATGDGGPVPEYFLRRGVPPRDGSGTAGTAQAILGDAGPEGRAAVRRLRACDVVLRMPRPRVELRVQGDADGLAALVVTLASPGEEDGPWISAGAGAFQEEAPPNLQEQLATGEVDTGTDAIRVATLWLLSPPGAGWGSSPDETWTFHAEHGLFWNLNHAARAEVSAIPPLRLSLGVPLAAGIGQSLVDDVLAGINQQDAEVAAFLSAGNVTGEFWTI